MPSDEHLMKKVVKGDGEALSVLMKRYSNRLYGHLFRSTRSQQDAEDLLQDTWIRVATKAKSFDPHRSFRPWVFGIASNLVRDLFRRRERQNRTLSDAAIHSKLAQPEPDLEHREAEILDHVKELPERMRQIVLLRFFEGLSIAEVAESLGVAQGTVKSRLHTAVVRLRKTYRKSPR